MSASVHRADTSAISQNGEQSSATDRHDEPGDTESSAADSFYQVRNGDTFARIATRFNIDEAALRHANDDLPENDDGVLRPYYEIRLPGVSDIELEIESVVHNRFEESGARLDGINEDDLASASLGFHDRWPIVRAHHRLVEVEDQQFAPLNKWDDRLDRLVGPFLTLLVVTIVLGIVALIQWGVAQFSDSFTGTVWVYRAPLGALALLVVVFTLMIGAASQSVRDDKRWEQRSKWPARQRDFESSVINFAIEPAIQTLAQVRVAAPSKDSVRVDSAALTTIAPVSKIVRTDTYRQISLLLSRADGATIGLRGSRGAGKTDLVRSFTGQTAVLRDDDSVDGEKQGAEARAETSDTSDENRVIGVFISAPTSKDEFAFLRRVGLLLCEQVLELDGIETGPSRPARQGWRLPSIGMALAVVGAAIVLWPESGVDWTDVGWALLIVGVVVAAFSLLMRVRWRRGISADGSHRYRLGSVKGRTAPQKTGSSARTVKSKTLRATDEAGKLRRRLRFSVETDSSAEGGVGVQGLSAKVSRTVTSAERPLTKDDVVEDLSRLVRFLDEAGYRVVIGVDELDKLQVDDDTAELLNSMKSLFAIPSCSFIVTISTSAWSTFEQRGLKVRSVFDSSFDEVIEARPLDFLDARRLLVQRRGMLSDAQVLFVTVTSGGIARDLLRNARRLAQVTEGQLVGEAERGAADLPLSAAARHFIDREAEAKVEAAILDLRGLDASAESDRLAADLARMRRDFRRLSADLLMARLTSLCRDSVRPPSADRWRALSRLRSGRGKDQEDGSAPDPGLARIEVHVVAYLVFLRLLERAFESDGPIAALATPEPVRFAESRTDPVAGPAWEAFESLQRARVELSSGAIAAALALREAADSLDRAERACRDPRRRSKSPIHSPSRGRRHASSASST